MSPDPSNHDAPLSVVKNSGGAPALASGSGGGALASAEAVQHKPRGVPYNVRVALNAFRGRGGVILGASVLLAVGLGTLAWNVTPAPVYPSEGLVRISYGAPAGGAVSQGDALPMFDAFMQSQKALVTSRRVIDKAIFDPVWQTTAHGLPKSPEVWFAEHLSAEVKPHNELITIRADDRDPQAAAAGVASIINAYADIYNAGGKSGAGAASVDLEQKRASLRGQIDALNEQLRGKTQRYGTSQLDPLMQDLQGKRSTLEKELSAVQIKLAETAAAPAAAVVVPAAPANSGELTTEQVAAADPVVRTFWEQQVKAQERVDDLTKHGYGKGHPLMANALATLQQTQAHVQAAVADYRRVHSAAASSTTAVADAGPSSRAADALRATEDKLRKMLDDTKAQMAAMAADRVEIKRIESNMAPLESQLAGVIQQMEAVNHDTSIGGRLTVISQGEIPSKSSPDWRWEAAGVGGLAGFLIPASLAMLVSLVRRRYRFSDEPQADLVTNRVPQLGLLPNVSTQRSTPQLRTAAAYAAHHLRVLLSSRATALVKRTFLLTSAGDGDGKTSVTMALAISFAAAHHRTLVIDGDFVGRRVTRGFNAESQEGLIESMGNGDMDGQWLNAATNLCILPTGKVDVAQACTITADNVRILLEQAIQHFDVVLIDTGSILGSPESAVLAREVDGVVVTIARGEQQEQVRRGLLRLEALGAMVVGTVFNRADARDFQSSYITPTGNWDEDQGTSNGHETELQQRVANFGPLVRAVAAAVPSNGHAESMN